MTNRTFDSNEQPIRQFIDEHPFVRENGPIRQTQVYPLFIKITVIYIIVPTGNPFCSRRKKNLIEEIIFSVICAKQANMDEFAGCVKIRKDLTPLK